MVRPTLLAARVRALCPEREFYMRERGRVRFVRVSSRAQLRALAIVAAVLVGWAALTATMAVRHLLAQRALAASDARAAAVGRDEAAILRWRRSGAGLARQLVERQRLTEDLVRQRLGDAPAPADAPSAGKVIGATDALPDLPALAARQEGATAALATLFTADEARLATRLQALGIRPRAAGGEGGPFIPWPGHGIEPSPALRQLAAAVGRWGLLHDLLAAAPTGRPTDAPALTSSFGVRADPFTGAPAFHAGLDFPGHQGQPIRAAAPGRVTFVGDRSGYGHTVEIEHGNGFLTRYGHLSGFDTRVGASVARGDQIARMGSTGRSTGTHLHFEVRVNGDPVNPLRFLGSH